MPGSSLSPYTRTREQLDAVLRSREGNLDDTPVPVLLLALAVREERALLTLRRNQLQKEVVFDEGSPVDCRSNIATETLGRFLVAAGKVSEQDCHAALAASASRGVHLEEILTERKLLQPTELYRVLQQNLGRKLLELFSWTAGTYSISSDVPPVESALRVRVPQLLVTGILKVETQESADEAVAVADGKYLAIAPEPLFGTDELRLNTEQQRVLDAIRPGVSLEQIRSTSGVAPDDVNRIVYALLLLGAVMVTDQPVAAAPQFTYVNPFLTDPEEAPAVAPAPMPPIAPRAAEPIAPSVGALAAPSLTVRKPGVEPALVEEVMAAYLIHRRKDAFDLLGAAETDGPLQFTRAFLAMADKFLPSKFDEKSPDGLREKAQDLFLAGARAYAELSDPDRRAALVRKRVTLRERPPAPPTPAPAPQPAGAPRQPKDVRPPEKTGVIDPEALCQKGRELAGTGKQREALSYFEMAAECDVQNGTYAAEVAWCRLQLDVSPPATVIKLLKNAIRRDPRSGLAFLYAGKVQATLGDRADAEILLNRAAMLMPKDLRVVEAMKALRAGK